MPKLNDHIIDEGAFLANGFVSTPICCPSRAELLTGKYFHNIGPPFPPNGSCMHVDPTIPVFGDNSLFQIMYKNGYHTGAFGKIMNDMPYWCNNTNNDNYIKKINGFSRLYIPCNYLEEYISLYLEQFSPQFAFLFYRGMLLLPDHMVLVFRQSWKNCCTTWSSLFFDRKYSALHFPCNLQRCNLLFLYLY